MKPQRGLQKSVEFLLFDALNLEANQSFSYETFGNVNRKNIETRGLELEIAWQALRTLMLRGQATYTDIDVKGENTVLTGRPEWVGSLSGNWQISANWDTTLDYRYTGEQWSTTRYAGSEESRELDAYHRIDWAVRWTLAEEWQLRFSADNLLDEDYQTSIGFPAPGRLFRFGVQFGL